MANIAPLRFLRRALMQRACGGLGVRGFAAEAAVDDDQPLEVEVREFKGHKVETPNNRVTTSKSEMLAMFNLMYRMRGMEIASDKMYKAKFIRGFCHLYDGQEAICVGMEAASNKKDSVITSYRDHCQYVGRGGSVQAVMSELMGRTDGATRGIGGSMHMYNRDANFYGGNGIVGAQIPLGAGIAFTHKYNNDGGVCYTLYGDGAANQGQKYEAMNIAALWKLPVVFVCENNHYGMGTAIWRAAFSADFYTRGDYVPGLKVDGMDPLAVKQACAFAKEYVQENGPIILEMDTYRYHGHSMSDPGSTYRTRDEVNEFRKERDPIERIKKLLMQHEFATAAELARWQRQIKNEVDATAEHAKSAPIPPNDWLWKNVYVDPQNVSLRGVDATARNPVVYDPEYKL